MAILQVREVPEGVYRKLSDRAKADHRSIAQEALSLIEKGLSVDTEARTRRQALIDSISRPERHAVPARLHDPAELVRQDRDR